MSDSTSDQKMDELADLMKTNTSVNDYTATEKHPHFDNYKNAGKIATSQKERRVEHLERQKERRNASFNRLRQIPEEDNEKDSEDEIEYAMEVDKFNNKNPFGQKKIPICKKYKNQLMLSEWLIDIPNELHGSWTMVVSPVGKRCLVVAKNGITKVYTKHGFCWDQFKSGLPGGDDESSSEKTILDGLCLKRNKTFYIIDVVYANNKSFYEVEAIKRFDEIKKVEHISVIKNESSEELPSFIGSIRCPCNTEEMTKMMSAPMKFKIDGLLFYNNDGWYTHGYTPLVGWLEPWMLPEVLNIPVHECYENKRNNLPLKEYVDDFNDRHNHHYVHGKPWEERYEEIPSEKDGNEEGKIVTD